jgi:photosystem II stability/assembly factor-like uncharacterized protein
VIDRKSHFNRFLELRRTAMNAIMTAWQCGDADSTEWALGAAAQLMSVANDGDLWLQLWLQFGPSAAVRPTSQSFISARQLAYGNGSELLRTQS